MSKQLGISIYPEHSTAERDKEYIKLAHQYGFRRIFTCLLSAEGNKDEIFHRFKEIISYANELEMQVVIDVAPPVLSKLNVSYNDLSFFQEMGAYGIRLDLGFTGLEESAMTYNPSGIKIEINMSQGTKYIDNIISYQANLDNLLGCHNFYPHRYSGLSYDHFIKCSQQFKEKGIRTAAFVNSPSATFGPWPVTEGLCTLEMHRDLPIEVQAKHLYATGLIDDVIIANAYASEEELKALSQVNRDIITLNVELVEGISDIERKIVLEEFHFYRGDVSEYLIRSTQSRVKYKAENFPPHHTEDIQQGDLLIDNELYGQYKGELQIALQPMKNSGKTNVIGRVVPEEAFLLKYLKPWSKFKLTLKK
ncbi:DUF871 domain-containing protein [Thermoflavimicrobium daqui]|uniref:DUF871 domain-containing protein n=1 Tax=Thermoflavimicrobium daqui TaxID=2137476 RepID=A0A364K2P1_9BACL|nr:DUF871 domain-containing protein [Thermoflavimicrobium daqui]RAL22685.1 DUF871 domain-containing protein [Thermoflavimicrobium daqui]